MWFLGLELLLQVLLPIPVVTLILQSLLIEWRVVMEKEWQIFLNLKQTDKITQIKITVHWDSLSREEHNRT